MEGSKVHIDLLCIEKGSFQSCVQMLYSFKKIGWRYALQIFPWKENQAADAIKEKTDN